MSRLVGINERIRRPLGLGFAVGLCALGLALSSSQAVQAQTTTTLLSQEFDDITTLPGLGYVVTNNSTRNAAATTTYFQGNDATFPAYTGAATSYIGANFNNTPGTVATGVGTISDFLICPNLTFQNGDVISFYTRTTTPGTTVYPDRLQLLFSTNGASTNVGAGVNTVGDFTTTLLTVNPNLTTTGYPSVWTQETATISGLSAPTSGRFAFRYYVTNGGPSGTNSDYIGIDSLSVTRSVTSSATPEPSCLPYVTIGCVMVGGILQRRRRFCGMR